MEYQFLDLIDGARVLRIMDKFHDMTKMSCRLTDLAGTVLLTNDGKPLSSGWQRICTDFHRHHPGSISLCKQRGTILSKNIIQRKQYSLYQCGNGLIDGVIPIYLSGIQVANLFTGQFFLGKPDLDYFRRQAIYYGFDEKVYLEALAEVPVLEKENVEKSLVFLVDFAELLACLCLKEKELLDLKNNLELRVDG